MRRVFYVTSWLHRYDQTLLQNRVVQNALRQIVGKIYTSQRSPIGTSLKAESHLVVQTRLATGIVHPTVDDSIANEAHTVPPVDTALRSNKRLDFCEVLLFTPYSYPIHPESD